MRAAAGDHATAAQVEELSKQALDYLHLIAQPALAPDAATCTDSSHWLADTCYWLLPKPVDLGFLLDEALESSRHFRAVRELEAARSCSAYYPELSVYTSLLFTLVVIGFAARRFTLIDY